MSSSWSSAKHNERLGPVPPLQASEDPLAADWLKANRLQLEISSPSAGTPADTCVATPCGSN